MSRSSRTRRRCVSASPTLPGRGCATVFSRIYIILRRESWLVNHKRVYRLYRQDRLSLQFEKPRRNVSAADRAGQPAAAAPNEMLSMGFVSYALIDGRRLRALTVVDTYTHEALAIDVDQGIKEEQVSEAMARIAATRGSPRPLASTTVRSSSRRHSTAGRMRMASGSLTPNEYAAAATLRYANEVWMVTLLKENPGDPQSPIARAAAHRGERLMLDPMCSYSRRRRRD